MYPAPIDTGNGHLVERLVGWLRHHYTQPVTSKELAIAFDRHPTYIGTVFHRTMGVSVSDYINDLRLEHAAVMILQGEKVEAVALCVGYRSKSTFHRLFKQRFKMTPTAYRARSRSAPRGRSPVMHGE